MPGSVIQGKEQIKNFIERQGSIFKIVDVGPGSGTYPKLLNQGDVYYWIGIEIFEPYVKMFGLKEIYNDIIIGDISTLPKESWPDADCIIFGDVLEHLTKPKAIEVLDRALAKYKHVIVSIPIGHWPAQEHYGNKHELHISTWTMDEIRNRTVWEEEHFFPKNSMGVFLR